MGTTRARDREVAKQREPLRLLAGDRDIGRGRPADAETTETSESQHRKWLAYGKRNGGRPSINA